MGEFVGCCFLGAAEKSWTEWGNRTDLFMVIRYRVGANRPTKQVEIPVVVEWS